MKKYNKTLILITTLVTLLPILAGVILWNQLPDTMVTHFDFNNQPNGFSSKAFTVFGIPAILALIHLFAIFVVGTDPKAEAQNGKVRTLVVWIVPIVSVVVCGLMYAYNMGSTVNAQMITLLLIGVLFVIIGNWFPKMRQNYTIGIRLPWTLANEENWKKTHHLSGYIWIAGGILMMVAAFIPGDIASYVVLVVVLACVLIPGIYSYNLHAKYNL